MKIVFLDAATIGSDISLEPIAALGEFVSYNTTDAEDVVERMQGCDVVVINKIKMTREVIDAVPTLKLICEAATGVNNIDVAYAESRGIPVKNVAAYSTASVVQTTFMHILALVGGSHYYDNRVKDGTYSTSGMFTDLTRPFSELDGKRIGIIGMGNIGSRVARVAEAFGMSVSYFSTSGTAHCKDYPAIELEELLSTSDIVSIHAPLNERTNGLIGWNELCKMRPSAYIVNAGRGGIIDEEALAKAVDEGVIAGAATDVFEIEPISTDNPLVSMRHPERVIFSPHIAWASREARCRLVAAIAKNIQDFVHLM